MDLVTVREPHSSKTFTVVRVRYYRWDQDLIIKHNIFYDSKTFAWVLIF